MHRATSRDGTVIAAETSGAGPPLVLVHGTGGARTRWKPVLPALEGRFRVYAVDRRGRGESSDHPSYALEREFEDVAAVVDSLGEPVHLIGHSYGALCSLEAARLTSRLASLVLYEPPLPLPGIVIQPPGVVERLKEHLAAGDRAAILTTFMTEVVRMPAHELAVFQGSPAWPARLAAAHTLPRELEAHAAYHFEPERFAAVRVPTLLLLGGASPPFFAAAVQAVDRALPNARVRVLPEQQHIAIDTAPELFASEILSFVSENLTPTQPRN